MFFANLRKNGKKTVSVDTEKGAALATAVIILAILSVIALTALAFSSTEARIAGNDLQRSQTFYAASTGLEKMTNDFSNLFREKMNPTQGDLDLIETQYPDGMVSEGFEFNQNLDLDTARLTELRNTQGLPANVYPRVNIPEGPYSGLYASIIPYKMSSEATMSNTGVQVKLEREFNNYLVPLFQFGIFSNEDVEVYPGPFMTFNGRVHANGNIYAMRNVKFLNRITTAGEWIRNAKRSGEPNDTAGADNVIVQVNNINVQSTFGSMKSGSGTVGGPNISGSNSGQRGFYPDSPNGIPNTTWESETVRPAANNKPNRFGGQLLTLTTGANELKLPIETDGNNAAELIKRSLPSDGEILSTQRYNSKAQIRILIDDETAGSGTGNVAGIPAGKGVLLSTFSPSVINNVLKKVSDTGTVSGSIVWQKDDLGALAEAKTVRGVKSAGEKVASNYIPPGAGIQGKILIEVIDATGTAHDVTQTILSMGITEGEPNGIVYLQRPLWTAYVQGSRDRRGDNFDLVNLTQNYQHVADGEMTDPSASFYANRGFINMKPVDADEDSVAKGGTGQIAREAFPVKDFDKIVPINVYNVREGWYRSEMDEYDIFERGITSVVEINMRNLSRWLDGVYDGNLLSGTNALSTNIKNEEGYVVYVSDRRGDKIKAEYISDGTSFASTNGIVDNEDIYGANNVLDNGEDVIDFGWESGGLSRKGRLQRDLDELPTTGIVKDGSLNKQDRAKEIMSWSALSTSTSSYFRRSVRLFNGEKLSTSAAADKLSPTKGITISSENMVYIWGNYNTTGVSSIPSGGSTLNNGGYNGAQVPSSIVCDAFFPLSKTWFDASSALYPEGSGDARNMKGEPYRLADEGATIQQSTAVRAGIIAGTNTSSMTAVPGRDAGGLKRNGGIVNYPRFLELWNYDGRTAQPWSYTGSFIPLFRSTQALSQWENDTSQLLELREMLKPNKTAEVEKQFQRRY